MIITTITRYGGLIGISQIDDVTGELAKPSNLFSARADHCVINNNDTALTFDLSFADGASYNFSVADAVAGSLIIDGVNYGADTAENIKIALGALFLNATGGGGGTTDNTTPPYLPFKSAANTFEDSSIKQTTEPAGNDFQIDLGKEEVSAVMQNDNINGVKRFQWGNSQPVVSPYDYIFMELDFILERFKILCNQIVLGDIDTSSALLRLTANTFLTELGDINNNNGGSKIIVDDNNGFVKLLPNGDGIHAVEVDAGNNIVSLISGIMKLQAYSGVNVLNIGDVDVVGNGTRITMDDVNQLIEIIAAQAARITLSVIDNKIQIGDVAGVGNGNIITVDDSGTNEVMLYSNNQVRIYGVNSTLLNGIEVVIKAEGDSLIIGNANNGHKTYFKNFVAGADTLINFEKVPNYIDNAAAVLAGRSVGDLYRVTGTGDLKVVI